MVLYTLLYLKWITKKDLLYSSWNSAQCYMRAGMGGRFEEEWIHIYICVAESLCCSPEAITALGFPGGSDGKESACNAGDLGSIPGSGRSPGEGNGNPLQYSCLEIPWTEKPGRLQSMGLHRLLDSVG